MLSCAFQTVWLAGWQTIETREPGKAAADEQTERRVGAELASERTETICRKQQVAWPANSAGVALWLQCCSQVSETRAREQT